MEAGRLAVPEATGHVQAARQRDHRAPATVALLELVREITREHAQRYEAELSTRRRWAQRSSAKT